jgi:NDP-sugar pyrophosphorylase family protein
MTAPTLLLLAAGLGSRYGGLKQLDGMGPNGETLLDYAIHDARRAGFGKAVFVIRRSMESVFQQQVLARYENVIPTELVFQDLDDLPVVTPASAARERPWGTGHAVLAARHTISEPFGVINADDYYGPSAYVLLAKALREFSPDKEALACVGYPLQLTLSEHGTVNRGLCHVVDDRLTGVEEVHGISRHPVGIEGLSARGTILLGENQLVSMNCWAMTPALFVPMQAAFTAFLNKADDLLKDEFYLPGFLNAWIARQGKGCPLFSARDQWCGVTYPADKPAVQAYLLAAHQAGRYPSSLVPCH